MAVSRTSATVLAMTSSDARTNVERACSEEKGNHHLADPKVRGLANVKIHVHLALCAQVIARIGAAITERLPTGPPMPCYVRA